LTNLSARSQRNRFGENDNNVDNSNSSTSTIPGYTFFKRSGGQIGDSNNVKNTKDSMGYVPSGMSREEYSTIRKMETEKEKKMNYGKDTVCEDVNFCPFNLPYLL
jgi:hypothetical protein